MLKRMATFIITMLLTVSLLPVFAFGNNVSLNLSKATATVGDSITATGTADPGSWVVIKVLDSNQSVVFLDAVKSDAGGNYTDTFKIPSVSEGDLNVIAGSGSNIASQILIIGTPTIHVTLTLSADTVTTGGTITASGTADPNTWVVIKLVDSGENIVYFNAVKADASGNYTDIFVVPAAFEGDLKIVAGYGENVTDKTLIVGTPTTHVTLTLSPSTGKVGDSITASGTADPSTWVVIKVVDGSGNIVYLDAVKADASGNYTNTIKVPNVTAGNLDVIAGYDVNVTSKILNITSGSVDECFIATAAFGSKFEPSVALLRSFRDNFLLTNTLGTAFVEFYYQNSPPIANYIAHNEILKAGVRGILTPVVGVVYLLFHPVLMYSVVIGLVLLMTTMGFLKRRKVTERI